MIEIDKQRLEIGREHRLVLQDLNEMLPGSESAFGRTFDNSGTSNSSTSIPESRSPLEKVR